MAISVTSLSERFLAKFAFERHVIVMNSQMISQVAQLWELKRALFALKYLVHPLGVAVQSMDQIVVSFVMDLFTTSDDL